MTLDFTFGQDEVQDFIGHFKKHRSINQLYEDLDGLNISEVKKVIRYCSNNTTVGAESFEHLCKNKAVELGCIHYTPRIRAACAILVHTRHKGE